MFYQVFAIILSEDGRMERVPLQSTTLASAAYHPALRRLEIEFRTGKRYLYFQVPPQRYHQLLIAESKGAYFNRHFRNCFPYQHLSRCVHPRIVREVRSLLNCSDITTLAARVRGCFSTLVPRNRARPLWLQLWSQLTQQRAAGSMVMRRDGKEVRSANEPRPGGSG